MSELLNFWVLKTIKRVIQYVASAGIWSGGQISSLNSQLHQNVPFENYSQDESWVYLMFFYIKRTKSNLVSESKLRSIEGV